MPKTKIISLLLLLITIFAAPSLSQEIPIVPKPKRINFIDGKFDLTNPDLTLSIFVKDTSKVMIGVNELINNFKTYHNINILIGDEITNNIVIGLKNANSKFDELCKKLGIDNYNKIGNQGYQISINNKQIVINANTKQGLYYGIQSVKQMLRGYHSKNNLPALRIVDYPSLKFRGVSDDISRGPIPTLSYMKYQIRRLAEMKMNYFTHYVEHVVKTKKHGEFAPADGSLTIEEWKELSDYADKYFIRLAGNFQSFGHFTNILNNPKYSHLGESGNLLSPVLPESKKFLKDIYTEMVPAFDSPWFCVNCDETFDLGRGYSKEEVEKYGYAEVYKQHILNIYNILKDLGQRTFIWGDIMLKYPQLMDELPQDIIVGTWTYNASDSFDDYIKPFVDKGFDIFISPGVLNSNKVMPQWDKTITNIHNFIKDGAKYDILGMQNTVWDDGGFAFFSVDWYGVAYSADQSWNPTKRDLKDFDKRFNQALYLSDNNDFTKALWKILDISKLTPTDGMNQKVVWLDVIPDRYKSLNISKDEWDKVLIICDQAEKYLNKADVKLHKEEIDYFKFIIELYRSLAYKRYNLLDAAANYKQAAIMQSEKPDSAREHMLNALDLISQTKIMQEKIIADYQKLWLNENHTYSLVKILDRFKKEANDLADINHLVFEALKQFDSRLYIPPPIDVRLDINEVSGKYFREWMMINPLPNKDGLANSQIDYLKDMGGEVNAKPKVTQEFYFDGKKYRWRRVVSKYFDKVDLDEIYSNDNQNVVMYAHGTITSPVEQIVQAAVGSDDGITVFINGQKVYEYDESRTLSPDEDKFNIKLHKGKNHLLLKISQTTGDWGFTFRLPESRVTNSKNRYYIEN